jgi:hypothetical protein
MQGLALDHSQPCHRVSGDLRQKACVADRQLHDGRVGGAVHRDARDDAGQGVVDAQAARRFGGEDDFARRDADPNPPGHREIRQACEQRAAADIELGETACGIHAHHRARNHRAEPGGLAQPRQIGPTGQRLDRTMGHHPSSAHDRQVRRKPHDVVEVVRDEHDGNVDRTPNPLDFTLKRPPQLSIDRGERLVEQQNSRLTRQRSCHRDTLALAAGQRRGPVVRAGGQMHEVEQRHGSRTSLATPKMAERSGDIAERGEMGKQGVFLKHEPHVPPVRGQIDGVVRVDPSLAAREHARVLRRVQSCDGPEDCGLAAAGGTEERQHLPGSHVNAMSSGIGPACSIDTVNPRSATAHHPATEEASSPSTRTRQSPGAQRPSCQRSGRRMPACDRRWRC